MTKHISTVSARTWITAMLLAAGTFAQADVGVYPQSLQFQGGEREAVITVTNSGFAREAAQVRVYRQVGNNPQNLERVSGFSVAPSGVLLKPKSEQQVAIRASDRVRAGCYRVLVDVAPSRPGFSGTGEVAAGAMISVRHSIPLCF